MSGQDAVLVPREPTDEMVAAGWATGTLVGGDTRIVQDLTAAYRAMLAAAPSATPASDEAVGDAVVLTARNAYIAAVKARFPDKEMTRCELPFNFALEAALQAARLAPIAPDARSVDGLSGEDERLLETWEQRIAKSPSRAPKPEYLEWRNDLDALCKLVRRLAGAKVQDGGE